MSSIDFDRHHLCPHCNEPMQVSMPIWITPGEESIDTNEIDYESGNPQESANWWCSTCESHHFPQPSAEVMKFFDARHDARVAAGNQSLFKD